MSRQRLKTVARIVAIVFVVVVLMQPVVSSASSRRYQVAMRRSAIVMQWCSALSRYTMWQYIRFSSWCTEPQEIPEPTPSPSMTPLPTTTPSPTPLVTATPTPEPTLEPTPTPVVQPTGEHLVISEVYYDVDSEYGEETVNEWVEIYNGTNDAVDLSGWTMADARSSEPFPDDAILSSGTYGVVLHASSTYDFWTFPESAMVITLESPIGNGLSNTGDALYLADADGVLVDAVSWEKNVDVFDLSDLDSSEGGSLARWDETNDTNLSGDWVWFTNPTPGQ